MDPVAEFADEVARFESWLLEGTDREAAAARNCLVRLLALYRTGLELPPAAPGESADSERADRVSDAERERALEAARRLPFDLYGEVFDPTEIPADAPVVGSLSDDVADIYGDVVTGLRAYRRGDPVEAVWEWKFGLRSHWGAHATGAIRALHWWLSKNAPE